MRHPTGKHLQANVSNLRRTDKLFARVFKLDDWAAKSQRCHYCLERIPRDEVTADHAIAKRAGGTTKRENIKAACFDCNNAKGSLSEAGFRDILHSRRVPEKLTHLRAWIRFRLERQTQQSLKRLCKYAGLPFEAAR